MSINKEMTPEQGEARTAEAEAGVASDAHSHRKLTFAENIIVTIKVLVGFALLGAALWGIELWIAAQ